MGVDVLDGMFGVYGDTRCSVWDYERLLYIVSTSNTFPTSLLQSDNIHISKMIVDKTVHNYALRSSKMGCIELYPLMSNRSIGSKPHRSMHFYRYYRYIVI